VDETALDALDEKRVVDDELDNLVDGTTILGEHLVQLRGREKMTRGRRRTRV
jgi:hypothetical protein